MIPSISNPSEKMRERTRREEETRIIIIMRLKYAFDQEKI
jgi:hypothetical protein